MRLPAAAAVSAPTAWRQGAAAPSRRMLPEEVPVALTYDRATFAVMMASPRDLADFCIGFSLSEGIVAKVADILDFEIVPLADGVECRMSLAPARRAALDARRRRIAGPAGCGLCGMESLGEAIRPPPRVTAAIKVSAAEIAAALRAMPARQSLNAETRGVHGAAWFQPGAAAIEAAMIVREDIGRHNALDKLHGALLRQGLRAADGVVLLTSRVSIELVQKAAVMGAGILVAISVPSARAVRDAQAAGITVAGIARADGFEVFTYPERIIGI